MDADSIFPRFHRSMRTQKAVNHRPSLRTALAIPRFLTARYFRKHELTTLDYIEAAVYNTPYDDQKIARLTAEKIFFPDKFSSEKSKKRSRKPAEPEDGSFAETLVNDLEGLNLDLDAFDNLDDLLEEEAKNEDFSAFDLFEKLISSDDPGDNALGEFINTIGGGGLLEMHSASSVEAAGNLAEQELQRHMGNLSPEQIAFAHDSGFSETMLRECRTPWELAGALAAAGRYQALHDHLNDLWQGIGLADQGKCIFFLANYSAPAVQELISDFRNRSFSSCRNLIDFAAFIGSLQVWYEPDRHLITISAIENPKGALEAADYLRATFGAYLHEEIFCDWVDSLDTDPHFHLLTRMAVPCQRWEKMLDDAYDRYLVEIDEAITDNIKVVEKLEGVVTETAWMQAQGTTFVSNLSHVLATDVLCMMDDGNRFLEYLDAFIARKVVPKDVDKLVDTAIRLGINPNEVYERLGDALDQLKRMIESNVSDAKRYIELAQRIKRIPGDVALELARKCERDGNQEGMAVILMFHLQLLHNVDNEWGISCIGIKGIGGGTNLLKQWYLRKRSLGGKLRQRIRDLARQTLLELGIHLAGTKGGSMEQGIIPRNQIRPYRSSDDLDLLDIEASLDRIIGSGRQLHEISTDDFLVYDTEKGAASFGVLLDISGSMEGEDLAICAISVVMLLVKLRSEEVAIALFESDTHAVKRFLEYRSLDEVADELLDLAATGGTRVDAALRWMAEEFSTISHSQFRVLFLLTDFEFWEDKNDVRSLAHGLAELRVGFMGAKNCSKGARGINSYEKIMLEEMTGETMKLNTLDDLPQMLTETIQRISQFTG